MAAGGTGRTAARRRRLFAAGAGVLAVGSLGAGTLALAQDEGGLFARIDVSTGLVAETGDGATDDVTARAGLSFGFDSVTRAQAFRFSAGTDFEVDGNGTDLVRPRATLSYTRSSRATELSFGAAYSEIDLDENRVDGIETDEETIADAGSRISASANLRLVTGRDARFGTDTQLSWSRRDYSGTTDPDLFASTTLRAATTLRFDLTPTASLRLTARQDRREDEDAPQTDRTTTRLGAGADLQLDRAWSLSADLTATTIETERDPPVPGPRVETETDGLDVALTATRALPNGSLTLGFRRELEVTGSRTIFDIGRSLQLREGELAVSLGVVRFDDGGTAPVATLSWNQALTPTSSVNASLSRSAAVNFDDENVLRTRLSLGYQQSINAVSGWSASLGLADTQVQGGTGDQRRIDFGLGYRHALTQEWDLSAGLNHRLTYKDGSREDSFTTLTLNVERSFLFRP